MDLDTLMAIDGGLTTLLNSIYTSSSSSSTEIAINDFGTATLLSLGESESTSSGVYDFGSLASLALDTQLSTSTTQTVSDEQLEAEDAIIEEATALRIAESYDEARDLLEDLLEENPTNGTAIHALGAIELDLGNYEEAEALFRKADYFAPGNDFDTDAANAKTLQEDDDYVLEQAQRLVASGDTLDQGVRLLTALTNRSPTNAVARSLLAESLITQGDTTNGLIQYQLAISTADQVQLQQLEYKLTELVESAPNSAYLHDLLGQIQLKLGKNEEAAETLGRANQLSEEDSYASDEALAYVALGYEALEDGDISGAMSSFLTAQELDPDSEEVNLGLAAGYLARGEYRARFGDAAGAIEELDSAKSYLSSVEDGDEELVEELTENIASAYYSAGRTLATRRVASGDSVSDEELAAFQAAYDLDPENSTYQTRLAETENLRGDEYLAEGDYKNAAYAYQHAYEVDSDEESYRDSAISAFLAWGDERVDAYDHHQAITAYQAAYDLDNDNETSKYSLAEALNRRGLFYRSLGDDYYDLAADDFEAALDLYPDNEDYQDNYDSVI